jgi:hypothetical protein
MSVQDDQQRDDDVYTFEELRSTGLLWLINASVFHPRGCALALVYRDGQGEPPTGWTLISAGDGQPFSYADDPEIHALFRQAEITLSLVTT